MVATKSLTTNIYVKISLFPFIFQVILCNEIYLILMEMATLNCAFLTIYSV
jgi:hypothetical protein